jgi:hypothetical protein
MDAEMCGHTLWAAVASLLLIVGSPIHAGTITCIDQVGALRAMLADHPNKSIREQLKEAERLCGEGRRAEALDIVTQARAAMAAQGAAAATSEPTPHK